MQSIICICGSRTYEKVADATGFEKLNELMTYIAVIQRRLWKTTEITRNVFFAFKM